MARCIDNNRQIPAPGELATPMLELDRMKPPDV